MITEPSPSEPTHSPTAPGPLLASGREADVFALDDRRVLRRYRQGGDVTAEAAAMAYLRDRGYPVPAVYEAAGTDLVMERVSGPTLAEALAAGDVDPARAGRLLAELHQRLHTLPPRLGRRAGDRILHLDLHPDNVILCQTGPMVIDWRNVTEGPPDLDLALTALILGEVGIGLHVDFAEPARQLLTVFLRHADGDPLSHLAQALAIRTSNPTLQPDEIAALDRAAALVVGSVDSPAPR
ncbi:MAG TPA: phosphotransferase [Natronosporangium sp.]|jgi:Ser/Thr protein kinase RdoA (MazF antagonist)|nr:phosphotransferase [Natronosporangium sp.]